MIEFEMLPTVYAAVLFVGYLLLWKIQQRQVRRATGRDPEVMAQATDQLQLYFSRVTKVLTLAVVVLIAVHASGLRGFALIERMEVLDTGWVDHVGLTTGALGLLICRIAQVTMGTSWRVGIDEEQKTALVTKGIYKSIRNPTYLGLFLINVGFWLIWPTCAIGMFAITFCFFLDIQVRCEEQHMLEDHGEDYQRYLERTKRYLPWVY